MFEAYPDPCRRCDWFQDVISSFQGTILLHTPTPQHTPLLSCQNQHRFASSVYRSMGSFSLLRVKITFVWWISAFVGMQHNDNIMDVCFAKLGVIERQKKTKRAYKTHPENH